MGLDYRLIDFLRRELRAAKRAEAEAVSHRREIEKRYLVAANPYPRGLILRRERAGDIVVSVGAELVCGEVRSGFRRLLASGNLGLGSCYLDDCERITEIGSYDFDTKQAVFTRAYCSKGDTDAGPR